MPPSVLFVCTANVCRSPMAEALFRARLKAAREDWQSWRVESAGTWANDGEAASTNSRLAMARRGLEELKEHRSKTVTQALLEQFDLILTMETGHKEALRVEFPALAGRIFLLSEMQGASRSVQDPYGGSLEAYERTAGVIDQMIANGFDEILTRVLARHSSEVK